MDFINATTRLGLNPEMVYNNFPQADMSGDGTVNVVDVVQLINLILNDPQTTSAERQELQRQLRKLNQNQQIPDDLDERQIFINRIKTKQQENY